MGDQEKKKMISSINKIRVKLGLGRYPSRILETKDIAYLEWLLRQHTAYEERYPKARRISVPIPKIAAIALALVVLSAAGTIFLFGGGGITISAANYSAEVGASGSASYALSLGSLGGPNAVVSLGTEGLPEGSVAQFSSTPSPANPQTTMTVSVPPGTPPGTYNITVKATVDGKEKSATLSLVVPLETARGNISLAPDFSVYVRDPYGKLAAGNATSYTVYLNFTKDFNGTVELNASGLPQGSTASFSQGAFSASGSASVTIQTSKSTIPGTYDVTVRGRGGAKEHSATIRIVVFAPTDFELVAQEQSKTIMAGDTASYAASVNPFGGFNSSVYLSIEGLPYGSSASFSKDSVLPGEQAAISVTTPPAMPPGTYTLLFSGTVDGKTHTVPITLIVLAEAMQTTPDFSMDVSPLSKSVVAGGYVTYNISMSPYNGFDSAISLGVSGLPTGATSSYTGSTTPPSYVILTVQTSADTPSGTYTITVSGNGSGRSHTGTATLIVSKAGVQDFAMSASTQQQSVVAGGSTSYGISLSSLNGFASPVTLSTYGTPSDTTVLFSQNPSSPDASVVVTLSTSGSTPAGNYTVTVSGAGGGQTHSISVNLSVSAQPDFNISIPASYREVAAGKDVFYSLSIASSNGFSSPVALSASGLPSGATAQFTPNPASAPSSPTMVISTSAGTATGTYYITVSGASSGKMRSATATLNVSAVPDFSLSVSQPSREVTAGKDVFYDIPVSQLNGFDSSVTFSVSGDPTGVTSTFTPNPATTSTTLILQTPPTTPLGLYNMVISATGGGITHSTTIRLNVSTSGTVYPKVAVILLTSMSATVGGADGCPVVSTSTSINSTEKDDIKTAVSNVVSKVSSATNGKLVLTPTYYEVSGTVKMSKNSGCTYWLAPWNLDSLAGKYVTRDTDFVLVFYDMVDDSTGTIKIDSGLGGGTMGADWGINGAGYSVQAMRYGSASFDPACDSSSPSYSIRQCGIDWLTQTTMHEWLHQMDYALPYVSGVPDRYGNNRNNYDPCGSAPSDTFSWFPGADDYWYDPDWSGCDHYCGQNEGLPQCSLDLTKLTGWNTHILSHYRTSTNLIGNHCRNGVQDSGETGIDVGGNGAAACQ